MGVKKQKITEVDVATPVVAWLQNNNWEVYKEVEGPGGRADIVAIRRTSKGSLVTWVVEVKTSASLTLLDQAVNWISCSHYVSIATPVLKNCNKIVRLTCFNYGIGHFEVKCSGEHGEIRGVKYPSLHRNKHAVAQLWKDRLYESQKLSIAGNNKNQYWSKYRETCRMLAEYVSTHQGCGLKEAIDNTNHHYASTQSARSCLLDLLKKDVVYGLRGEFVGKEIKLYTK